MKEMADFGRDALQALEPGGRSSGPQFNPAEYIRAWEVEAPGVKRSDV